MVEVWIAGISAHLEPGTAGTATTIFSGYFGATLRTYCAHVLGDGRQYAC